MVKKGETIQTQSASQSLTSDGFQFILQDPPTQAHTILYHYMKRKNADIKH